MTAFLGPRRPGDDGFVEPRLVQFPGTASEPDRVPASEPSPDPWLEFLPHAHALFRPGALERGLELRHVRRLLQPLADSVLAGERVVAALANVEPGVSVAAHAAHTSLAAMCVAVPLGLSRADIADVGVAALLHDAGRTGSPLTEQRLENTRLIMRSTTWSPLSLRSLEAALAHHDRRDAPLVAQIVAAADAYVSLLAMDAGGEPWLSPASSLARVLGSLRERWHPAIAIALVRGLGLYPPGQVVQLDDGWLARALAPDPQDPARPWIARLVDARGLPVPAWVSVAAPMQPRRRVVRALPRQEWPELPHARPAA